MCRLGSHVRALRRAADLTQQQAADLAGLSVAALRDLEQGRVATPRSATLRRLAQALRLPPAEAEELMRRGQPGQGPADDLWLQVLGPVTVHVHGELVELASSRQRLLLGMLSLAANTPVGQDRLIEAIWGNRPPSNVAELLRTNAARLRRRLPRPRAPNGPPELVTTAGSYQLTVSDNQLDLLLFRRLVDLGRRSNQEGDVVRAARLLREAVALWRGAPLADVPPQRADPTIAGLSREWHAVVVDYARATAELGRAGEALPVLRQVIEADPLHEPAYVQLLRALAASGQPATATQVYHTLRRRLADELGTDPGPELVAAYQAARSAQPTRPGPHAAPYKPAPGARPAALARRQLPPDLAEFTGRTAELATLHAAAARPARGGTAGAVCTISGMGGVGKTRLAVHFAQQRLADGAYPGTQLYVDLGGAREPADPAAVLAALLGLLGVPADQVPPDLAGRAACYRDRLSGAAALVLLDDAASHEQVVPLLPASSTSLVLVTSRRSLALDGAQVMPLDVFPPADSVRLLGRIAGGRHVADDPVTVRRLVDLCGHLPLAVCLAGRRLRARPSWRAADLVHRLENAPDRLRELAAGSGQLRAVFDPSYRDLPDGERRLFRLLARHPHTPVTVESAARLAGVPPATARRLLDRLADEHLVTTVAGGHYRLPDLLRHYPAPRSAGGGRAGSAGRPCPG